MEVNNETDPTSPNHNDPSNPHTNSHSNNKPIIDIPQSIVSSHNSSLSFYGKESKLNPTNNFYSHVIKETITSSVLFRALLLINRFNLHCNSLQQHLQHSQTKVH